MKAANGYEGVDISKDGTVIAVAKNSRSNTHIFTSKIGDKNEWVQIQNAANFKDSVPWYLKNWFANAVSCTGFRNENVEQYPKPKFSSSQSVTGIDFWSVIFTCNSFCGNKCF